MKTRQFARFSLLLAVACALCCGPALARGGDHHDPTQPADEDKAPPSIATSLPPPLSEPAVARDALAARGFEFGIKYIGRFFPTRAAACIAERFTKASYASRSTPTSIRPLASQALPFTRMRRSYMATGSTNTTRALSCP
jgi:hypothetical protein